MFLHKRFHDAVAFEARNDMHVRVHHILTPVNTIVHFNIEAVCLGGFFDDGREFMHQVLHASPFFKRCFKNILSMALWYHERVTGVCGMDIKKRVRDLVFCDFVGRNGAVDYLAKNTIMHEKSVLPGILDVEILAGSVKSSSCAVA
jgi:hypothetical protein